MAKNVPSLSDIVVPFLRRAFIELGPALLFFGVFFWKGITVATAVFMAAAVLSVAVSAAEKRQVPLIPTISAGIVLSLGGLTLVLEEDHFIKIEPTVVNGLFAISLAGASAFGTNILQRAFSQELRISEDGWRILLWRTVAYLALLAVANEVVWRSFSTETWVVFKTAVKIPANAVFALSQVGVVRRNWNNRENPEVSSLAGGGCALSGTETGTNPDR